MTVPARAAALFTEAFDSAQPGSAYTGIIPGTGFRATSGNVDVIGSLLNGTATAFFTCPTVSGGANNCLDLNGNFPGTVTTTSSFNLSAGTSYTLSFDLGGSVVPASDYAMHATIGDSAPFTFSRPAGGVFGTETVNYTPATNQPNARLSFASDTSLPGDAQFGPVIDNVTLGLAGSVAPATASDGSSMLFQQDLSHAQPGPNYTGALSNTGFTVTAGNVDILGNGAASGTAGFYACPAPSVPGTQCIDMNGYLPGTIQTDQSFSLRAGSAYTVKFGLAGNVPNSDLSGYVLNASFGKSGAFAFTAPPNAELAGTGAHTPEAAFQPETFTYTPALDEPAAQLVFASGQNAGSLLYGPILTAISIVGPSPANSSANAETEVPEPASLGLMLAGMFGLWVAATQLRVVQATVS